MRTALKNDKHSWTCTKELLRILTLVNLRVMGSSDRNSTGEWWNSAKLVFFFKSCGSSQGWTWRSRGSSDKNSTEKWQKSVTMVKRILEDPHCIGLAALGRDHEIKLHSSMLKKCQNDERDPWGSTVCWTWGSWGSSAENSEKIVKKYKNGEKYPRGSSLWWLGTLGDHQIITTLINFEKVSKWWKGSLRIFTFLDWGGLGDCHLKTPLKKLWKNFKMVKRILEDSHSVGLGTPGDRQIKTALTMLK